MAHERWIDVALLNPDEDDYNTIALTGVDIVFPLERDPEEDPLQDDEVRLRSEDGAYDESITVDDRDVEIHDDRLFLYRFRDVPPGVYRVFTCVGGVWSEAMRGLVVSKRGVHYQGRRLDEGAPVIEIAGPPEREAPAVDEGGPEYLEYVDGLATD